MAIYYRKVQNNQKESIYFGKWYGRAVILNAVTTKQLAEEISHSTTVTYSDVVAVLAEVAVVMKNHLQDSKKVIIDGVGSFKVGLSTKPADTNAEFNSNKISGYHIIYTPEKTFTAKGVNENGNRTGFYVTNMLDGVTAKEAPINNAPVEAAAGDSANQGA